jgi:hypothetical protein
VLGGRDSQREFLDIVEDELRLHWSYLGTIDPDVTFEVLSSLQLRAQV